MDSVSPREGSNNKILLRICRNGCPGTATEGSRCIAHSKREEAAICRIKQCMEGFINPFAYDSKDLVHIVSGVVVPDAIAKDIQSASEKGELCFKEFCQDRLLSDKKGFHDAIKNPKLKSFSDVGKVAKTKSGGKETVLKSERNLMARLVIIGRERGIEIEELLVYTLGPMPLALAYPDGGLMKTQKAKLLHNLEEKTPSCVARSVAPSSVWIVDAMAILQSISIREIPKTFGELATLYLKKVGKSPGRAPQTASTSCYRPVPNSQYQK